MRETRSADASAAWNASHNRTCLGSELRLVGTDNVKPADVVLVISGEQQSLLSGAVAEWRTDRNADIGCVDKRCISAESPGRHVDMKPLLDLLQNTLCAHSSIFDKQRTKGRQLSRGEERIPTSSDSPTTMFEIFTVPWHIRTDIKYCKIIHQLYHILYGTL